MTKTKILAVQIWNGRWRFATTRKNGTLCKSLRTWKTKSGAVRAGKREFRQ